jgi:hypothetical protein
MQHLNFLLSDERNLRLEALAKKAEVNPSIILRAGVNLILNSLADRTAKELKELFEQSEIAIQYDSVCFKQDAKSEIIKRGLKKDLSEIEKAMIKTNKE